MPEPETTKADDQPTRPVSDWLHKALHDIIGGNWRHDLTVTMRADKLYWLVNLIEAGIEARKQQWAGKDGEMDAASVCSLADFRANLEELAILIRQAAVKAAAAPTRKPAKRRR